MVTAILAANLVVTIAVAILVWRLRGEAAKSIAPSLLPLEARLEMVRSSLEERFQSATADSASRLERSKGDLRQELSDRLDGMFRLIKETVEKELGNGRSEQAQSLLTTTTGLESKFDNLQEMTQRRIDDFSRNLGEAFNQLRIAQTSGLEQSTSMLRDEFGKLGTQVGQNLEAVRGQVDEKLLALSQGHSKAQENLRSAVENRLDAIRSENSSKLDEMRRTVDEKLQTTLEQRLSESFRTVTEQLERVYQGLGEMQSLAAGVGDLKRVLSNVKIRGTWGEIQLGALLEQFLAPGQYIENAQVRDDSSERVEFAIRLPGRDGEHEVLLPIDAKFPNEDFDRLIVAAENGDSTGVEQAASALEDRIRGCARSIREKYINPPRTTDIAILFLPTESLYAEILRRPGFFEQLQREYHVTLAGPTTLAAILNALQMGFRSIAIEKRTSEVWQILQAIRTEFSRYGEVIKKLRKQLNTAANTVDDLGKRSRVMDQKLRQVETIPVDAAEAILSMDGSILNDEPEDEDRVEGESNGATARTSV